MKITVIPAYAYIANTQIGRADASFLFSDKVLQTAVEYGATNVTTTIQSWSNIQDRNLARVNSFFGDSIITNKYELYCFYTTNTINPSVDPLMNDNVRAISSLLGLHMVLYNGNSGGTEKLVCINNNQLNIPTFGNPQTNSGQTDYYMNFDTSAGGLRVNPFPVVRLRLFFDYTGVHSVNFTLDYNIFSDLPIFDNAGNPIMTPEFEESDFGEIGISGLIKYDSDSKPYIDSITITARIYKGLPFKRSIIENCLADFNAKNSGMHDEENDPDNPYGIPDNSTTGGGDGSYGNPDAINPAVIPALPTINVCDLGLITMYNPTQSQVKLLSDFLWSNTFDLNTYKKLFGDPMEGIIGLAIVPVAPTIGGSKNVKIGNIDSGINMSFLASNWAEVDCGWCDIEKYVGCFMDADPYTKISVYLPFIGIRSLSADDINGGSIHIVYHVDVLTGACACFIEHSERGVLYTYNGSCITNVPLTAINFSGAIQNAVSAVISGIGVAAGMATGAAPVTAMGAMGLLNSAANTAINSKPHIQRSGNLGGSAGILSILTPYVIIERPQLSVPYNMQHYIGQTCNITYYLSQLSGFTMCEYVHIENCSGTSEEIAEIEALLKEGVYL